MWDKAKGPAKISFLSLPTEIRIMIYELIMLSEPAKGEIRSLQYQQHYGIRRSNYDQYHCNLLPLFKLPGFCTANRQIYFEMEKMLHSNPVQLTIIDDLSDKGSNTVYLEQLVEQYSWIQANIEEIHLKFTFNALDVQEYDKLFPESKNDLVATSEEKAFSVQDKTELRKFCAISSLSGYCGQPEPKLCHSIQAIASFLSSLPRLQRIELSWNHPDTSKSWAGFWRNLNVIIATGATCSLIIFEEEDIVKIFRVMQQYGGQLMIKSTWQYGEHIFGEDHASSKTWRRAGLYSRLRWENAFRLVSPDGCMSIPVLIKNIETYF